MKQHPDPEVQAAIVRLSDALCYYERATYVQSVLVLKEQGGFQYRAVSGKPGIPDDVEDAQLFAMVGG